MRRDFISNAIAYMPYPDFEVREMATLGQDYKMQVAHPSSQTHLTFSVSYARLLGSSPGTVERFVVRRIRESVERIWSRWEAL